jgi:hypothetical protein
MAHFEIQNAEPPPHLFETGIAGTLANTVDRHFRLSRTTGDSRKGVGCRQAEVVVAVRGPHDGFATCGHREYGWWR